MILQVYHIHSLKLTNILLVGGFNPLEKYYWNWIIFPNFRGESKKIFQTNPPSFSVVFCGFHHHFFRVFFFKTQPPLPFPSSKKTNTCWASPTPAGHLEVTAGRKKKTPPKLREHPRGHPPQWDKQMKGTWMSYWKLGSMVRISGFLNPNILDL